MKLKRIIAFSHIEKAAGTTLIHVLRRIYFLRFAAVRPQYSSQGPHLTRRDLLVYLRLNPFLQCISGHSLVAHNGLSGSNLTIDFITQLREPVARTISQFRFWNVRMGKNIDPDQFLQHHTASNFQVKKIAGCEDLALAKEIITKQFLLAGTVEQFDEFLVFLARQLAMPLEAFVYHKKNQAEPTPVIPLPSGFDAQLEVQNRADTALYNWVKNDLFQTYISQYPGDFEQGVNEFQTMLETRRDSSLRPAGDFLYRNLYLKPLTGLFRLTHGLPYRGSYGSD